MDDIEIEVFRADTRASRGITAANLAEVAAFDCAANPVPNVLGHPAGDKPAIDRVKSFRVDGSSLFATVPKAAAAIWGGIKDGSILNRSMAFFDPQHEANPTPGKWAPRHLGWLGGAAPGIPGLPPLQEVVKSLAFSADGETLEILGAPAEAVIYAPAPTATVTVFEAKEKPTMETPEQIAAAAALKDREDKLAARELAFAASEKTTFEAGNSALVDGLVAAGKVLPAEVGKLKLVFNALGRDELTFDAEGKDKGTAAVALATFLGAALPARVDTSGKRLSPSEEFQADDNPDASTLTAQARELMGKEKGLTFEAAIERVSGS